MEPPRYSPFCRNHVEVDGGAHIHHHARAAVFVEAGDSVDQAVGAHFVRVVVAYGEPDIGARRDEHGFGVEVALGHERQGGIDGRHHARNDDAVDLGDIQARREEEIAQQDAPLVGGLFVDRAQAPLEKKFAAFESADRDVAVTCVKSQQHVRLLQESGYRFHRLAHDEEARRVEARRGSGDGAARLIDGHAPSGDVAGSVSEEAENGLGVFAR